MLDPSASRSPARQCVLVVDDDEPINEMLQTVLEMEGYDVVAARSGPDALAVLTNGTASATTTQKAVCYPVDLILLDLQMPDMGGEELVTQLVQHGYQVPPIVVLSAKREQAVETTADAIGAAAFLLKPFQINDLLDSVQRVLGHMA